jgi:hypothetical protein
VSGEYLLIGGSRDGQRITTERYHAVLELPIEDNSYPVVTEVYRSMAISGQNEEIIVYRSAGRTVDQALRQLVSGYRRGES